MAYVCSKKRTKKEKHFLHINKIRHEVKYYYCNLLLMQKLSLVANQEGFPQKDDFMTSQFCDECHKPILSRIIIQYSCNCGFKTTNKDQSEIHQTGFSHDDPNEQILDPICSVCKMGVYS